MDNVTLRVTRTIFDIESFDSVLLGKDVNTTPVASVDEALSALNGDNAKLVALINVGLAAEARKEAYSSNSGWHSFKDESKGAMSELNGEYTGTPVSTEGIDKLVLTLAKTVFGYNKDASKEQRAACKQQARDMIKATPAIVEGLKKSASLEKDEEE